MSETPTATKNYPKDVFHYDPNKPAAVIAGIVYAILSVVLFVRVFRHRHWWGLCLPIGTVAFAIGFVARFLSAQSPDSFPLFIMNQTLLVVSPAFFIAFNYVVYGRFIAAFSGGDRRFSLVRPQLVAKIFVTSDVLTFMIQGAGGGLEAQGKPAGRFVLLTGIMLQAVSYAFFYVLLIHSHRKFNASTKFDYSNFPWRLLHVLHVSSICILIRATYRSIELIQGTTGFIASHEIFFYTLDTIPLFFATAIYTYFWPGVLIEAYNSQGYSSVNLPVLRGASP